VTYRIELLASNPAWQKDFREEEHHIRQALGEHIARIHHVGSTAIRGIRAKPIVDIAVESSNYPPSEDVIEVLRGLGYSRRGESGVPGRHWFTKGEPRTHHLHWCPLNGEVVRRQAVFVERLNSDATLAHEYEMLKIDLANRFPYDHDAYALGKSKFVERIVGNSNAEELRRQSTVADLCFRGS
jgi:GrpB-like predicted nucleotidyltransferase (UPF0157 family)